MRGARSRASRLVVAGLLCLGVAAGVDALRHEPKPARAPRNAPPPHVVAQLRAAGVSGILTYSDERCRLHAVRLPGLEPVSAPAVESCKPHISSGGIAALEGDVTRTSPGCGSFGAPDGSCRCRG